MFATAQTASAWGSPAVSAAVEARACAVGKDDTFVSIKKRDDEQQIVMGEVYAPAPPDSQGDFMTETTIQKMAYDFMARGLITKIDVGHSQIESGCFVVESFIARKGDPDFIPGSWVLGVKIPDPETWALVKNGELNGFSLDGEGFRVDTIFEIDMPDEIRGRTLKAEDGHDHEYVVKYDTAGNFLGGHTLPDDSGHAHVITRGTVTEVAKDHSHRFSFVEGILGVSPSDESH